MPRYNNPTDDIQTLAVFKHNHELKKTAMTKDHNIGQIKTVGALLALTEEEVIKKFGKDAQRVLTARGKINLAGKKRETTQSDQTIKTDVIEEVVAVAPKKTKTQLETLGLRGKTLAALNRALEANGYEIDSVEDLKDLGLTFQELVGPEFPAISAVRANEILMAIGDEPQGKKLPGQYQGIWAARKEKLSTMDTDAPKIEDAAVIEFNNSEPAPAPQPSPKNSYQPADKFEDFEAFERSLNLNRKPLAIKSYALENVRDRYFGGPSLDLIYETFTEFFEKQLAMHEKHDHTEEAIQNHHEKLSVIIDKVSGVIALKEQSFDAQVEEVRLELAEQTKQAELAAEKERLTQLKETSVSNIASKIASFQNRNLGLDSAD
ncbi:MAG: hypothetical protein FWE31_04305 [Firmicutes bacterium]|nr:hypothetical protein [Bacillota bacterium]